MWVQNHAKNFEYTVSAVGNSFFDKIYFFSFALNLSTLCDAYTVFDIKEIEYIVKKNKYNCCSAFNGLKSVWFV